MEGQDVDPSFAQHFARRVWQFAQEKEYFEERRKYRQWWWDHTVVVAYKCLTWSFAVFMFYGSINVVQTMIIAYLQFLGFTLVIQIHCSLARYALLSGCFDPFVPDCSSSVVSPFSYHLVTNTPTWYFQVANALEETFMRVILGLAVILYNSTQYTGYYMPWMNTTGLVCR